MIAEMAGFKFPNFRLSPVDRPLPNESQLLPGRTSQKQWRQLPNHSASFRVSRKFGPPARQAM
jgi:hypothetical protein